MPVTDYELSFDEVNAGNVVDVMKPAVVAAAEDLRAAIRFVKGHSEDYGIDPDRIGLLGFSAGAVSTVVSTCRGCVTKTSVAGRSRSTRTRLR